MKEGTVRTRDGTIFYRYDGEGEPLLLIHSIGLSSELWDHVIDSLSGRFSVFAPDLIGHGDSDKPDKYYEVADHAQSMIEFMDLLRISKTMIIGSSLGAMISLEMSASFPDRVIKQVAVACPVFETGWDRLDSAMLFAHRYDAEGYPRVLTMDDLSFLYAKPTAQILKWTNKLRARAGIWCKRDQMAVSLWDILTRLPLVSCPTIVLYGEKDGLGAKAPVLIDGIKDAESVMIEDASHFPQIDNPGAFLKPVMNFL